MIQPRPPQIFDIVAVVNSAGVVDLEVRDVGTVIELLPADGLEVEFLDREGRARCVATLTASDVVVLNRERSLLRPKT